MAAWRGESAADQLDNEKPPLAGGGFSLERKEARELSGDLGQGDQFGFD